MAPDRRDGQRGPLRIMKVKEKLQGYEPGEEESQQDRYDYREHRQQNSVNHPLK